MSSLNEREMAELVALIETRSPLPVEWRDRLFPESPPCPQPNPETAPSVSDGSPPDGVRDLPAGLTQSQPAPEELPPEESFSDIVIDGIPGVFYVLNQHGGLLRWNQAYEKQTGLSPQELRRLSALAFVVDEDRELVAGKIREVFERGVAQVEARVALKDGIRHFLLTGRRMMVREHSYLVGSGIDITGRIQAEAALREARDLLEKRVHERTCEWEAANQSLRESEDELAAIYENAPPILMLVDAERRIRKVNKAGATFAGADADHLNGARPGEALRCLNALDNPNGCGLGPRCQVCSLRRTILDTLATNHNHRQVEASLSFLVQGREQTRDFLVSTARLRVRGEPQVLLALEDISERKRAERALRRANATLQAIRECHEVLLHATTELELLREVCRIIVNIGGGRMAWIGFVEPETGKTVRPVAQAGLGKGYIGKARITWADTTRGRGPTGLAIRTGQACLCRDTSTDPRFAPWRTEALKRGYGSVLALPLVVEKRRLGALTIYSPEKDAFDAEEQRLLADLANDLAFGITTLRTRAERERLQRELLEISEREQRRIAQDLHDGLCQQLAGISCLAGTLRQRLAAGPRAEARMAGRVADLLLNTSADARKLSHGLYPIGAQPDGLAVALGELADTTRELFRIRCQFRLTGPVLLRDTTAATHLFRIAQESVNNAVKHGRARNVLISLRRARTGLVLRVRDDGKGLPKTLPPRRGLGFQIMNYRAAMIGAALQVRRAGPRGTIVTCSLPGAKARSVPRVRAASSSAQRRL